MKWTLPALVLGALALGSCSKKAADSTAAENSAPADSLKNFVNWTEVGLHETPTEKGKYVTSIYIGEQITLVGDTASEKSGDRTYHYHKIQLSDGKQGWVRDEFIAIESLPAASIGSAPIFKRPDIAAVTGKEFGMMDFVAVKPSATNWVEVTGKVAGEKWFTTGYIQKSDLTFDPIDIEFACLNRRRNETTNENLAATLLKQMESATFQGSMFYDAMFEEVSEGDGGEGDADARTEIIFQSQNYPTYYMTVVNNTGELSELDDPSGTPEASFHLLKGRNPNCVDCIMLEASSFPGNYLCATRLGDETRMTLININAIANEKRQQYIDAASFRIEPGQTGAGISFAAYSQPGYYIRHRNFHLILTQNDGDIFAQDASFTQMQKEDRN